MRLISEQDVERLVDPATAIAAVADGYRRNASGQFPEPGRLDLARQQPNGSVLVLAGHSDSRLFAAKTNIHVYPDPLSRHRLAASMMIFWDAIDCKPLALIATTAFNNYRTAAGLAAVAQQLARPDSKILALFGAGKIAPAIIRYLMVVRPFERILILGRGATRAIALAQSVASWPGFENRIIAAETDPYRAASQADVIVTITTSTSPVFPGAAVKPGSLVILAGANRPEAREADNTLIKRARIYVDNRKGCVTRSGDLKIPLASGDLKSEQIVGEIGQAFDEKTASDAGWSDVTVFKSMGIIAQDIALAELVLKRAEQEAIGVEFDPSDGFCEALELGSRLPATRPVVTQQGEVIS